MAERNERHGWIDLLVPDGPFLSAAALDVQTVGENWPTRLSAEQRALLLAPPASEADEGEGWDDSSWGGRRSRVLELLTDLLGYREGNTLAVAPGVMAHHHIYRARVAADFVVHASEDSSDARMVVICGPDAADDPARLNPSRTHSHDGWVSTAVQRAALLARQAGADLALVSNGREHLLVNVVTGTTGSAMWTFNGLEDRQARDAFVALLHKQRVLHRTIPLSRLIELSQDRQHELTDTLGRQVRRAAETLVNAISRANRSSRGRLLEDLSGQQVYGAATRVLMRTVFLLVAEERGLLPVAENQLYADQYAMSTLLDKLEEDAYRNRSAMERRSGAWQRMMALSRAVHAGIDHDDLRLPAYGGNLFDPDEHPFLEARIRDGDDGLEQLDVGVVDDFTVLTVLRHLQIANGQRISFRSLDVEQIGHVYEALLDHSAVIVTEKQVAVLGLVGKAGNEPEIPLVQLEDWTTKSDRELGKQLVDRGIAAETKGVYKVLENGLAPDSQIAQTLNVAVANDAVLRERIEPYAPLLRTDARGVALVFRPGDVYVTETSRKRDSGTAYTARSLADEVAKHTLDPLIYEPGPHNEPDEFKWKLKAPEEILDLKVCDPAVGSAAILVAAVRYLAEALLQSRVQAGQLPTEALASGASDVESTDERVQARRAIIARCAYGVDRDPMAVEMAKLSLWLVSMARDRPFTFLDHAIRHGDSLLGVTSLAQLELLHMAPQRVRGGGRGQQFDLLSGDWHELIAGTLGEVREIRRQLARTSQESLAGVEEKARHHERAAALSHRLRLVADALVGTGILAATDTEAEADARFEGIRSLVDSQADEALAGLGAEGLAASVGVVGTRFFHWPLEFPEVEESGGFDAVVGNPPYLDAKKVSTVMGDRGREFLIRYVAGGVRGNADLVGYFLRRISQVAASIGCLTTTNVNSSETARVSLEPMLEDGWRLVRCWSSVPWPGAASVQVAKLWLTRRDWNTVPVLNGEDVGTISATLRAGTDLPDPRRLDRSPDNFRGVIVNGAGFILNAEGREELVDAHPQAADLIRPYITAADLNGNLEQGPTRWVIDCTGMQEEELRQYCPPVFEHLHETVRMQRAGLSDKKARVRDRWWLYEVDAAKSYKRIRQFDSVLAIGRVSNTAVFWPVDTKWVHSEIVLTDADDDGLFCALNSSPHFVWAMTRPGRMRTDLRYSGTKMLATFPIPKVNEDLREKGTQLRGAMEALMNAHGVGLTKLVQLVAKGESVLSRDVRFAQTEADKAYLAAINGELNLDLRLPPLESVATDYWSRWTVPPLHWTDLEKQLIRANARICEVDEP